MTPKNYEIKNSEGEDDVADVLIYDSIDSFTGVRSFLQQLQGISAKTINLRIHSPGGSVFGGTAMFNAVKRHPAHVVTHVDGIAASMASIVALAGNEVRMAKNAMLMVHNPTSCVWGEQKDLAGEAALLGKIKANMVGIYCDKTGLSAAKVGQLMDDETWLTADEAKRLGFVDTIDDGTGSPSNLRDFNLAGFRNVPQTLAANAAAEADTIDWQALAAEARLVANYYAKLPPGQSEAERASHLDELAALAEFIGYDQSPAARLARFIKIEQHSWADETPEPFSPPSEDITPKQRLARGFRVFGESSPK